MGSYDFFKEIVCINLDSRPDRWSECCKIFKDAGIHDRVKRFSAIAGKGETPYASGALGCALSHCAILKKCLSQGLDNVLVLEDDVYIRPDAQEVLNLAIKELPKNWDLFYLGFLPHGIFTVHSPNLIKIPSRGDCTHAVAYSKTAMKFIVDHYDTIKLESLTRIPLSIDGFYSSTVQSRGNCYCTNPIIAVQRNSRSDISDEAYRHAMGTVTTNEYNVYAAKCGSKPWQA
jgi:glycosyl transferase, family 25